MRYSWNQLLSVKQCIVLIIVLLVVLLKLYIILHYKYRIIFYIVCVLFYVAISIIIIIQIYIFPDLHIFDILIFDILKSNR